MTRFTAQLLTKSCEFNVFATFAEHPPHRIPSIEYSLVFVAAADDDASILPTSSAVEVVSGGVKVLNAAKRVVVVALVVPLCRAKLRFCTISPREKQTASTAAREYPRVIAFFVVALDRANDAKTGVVVIVVVVLFLARRRRNGEAEEELSSPIADERRRLPSAALSRRRRKNVVVIGAFLPLK